MKGKVTCSCGHSWSKSDSNKKDANVCHICGKDNTMKDGGWLDQYKEGGIEKGKNIKSTKTVDAGMLPEVTVVGSNDPQTEEFYRNILDNLPRDDSMGWYEGYMDLGKKYGFPKVHPIDKNSIIANIAKEQSFRKSKKPTPTYNPLTKTIESNDINKWVSEMSHHVQFKNNPTSTAFKALTKDLPINLLGKNPYKTPGTMEHEAHSIIEPQLRDEISQSVDSYYNLPYIDKKITEDMEYGLSRNFKFENGGWLDKFDDGGPVQPNYNDYSVSAPEGFVGDGYSNVGRNYSPAWGGQFAMGGSMPGSVGFMYARTNDPAPSEGKYAKKTMASAQNGTEMEYYQNGLDWKPRSMAKGGNLYTGKDPKKFDKNVAKSDETKKSPAINYRSTADSERIAREKELARRQTSVSAYDQKGMSPEVRKSVGEAMENKRVYDDRVKKFADVTQILGAGLEVAAPFTGPAAPALGAIGAGLGAGSSAYLAGKDAMAGDYKSALTNAAFGGLDVAGFSAIRNMGLKNAVSAADQVSDFGQVTDPSQLENLNIFTGKAPKGSLSNLLGEVKGRFNPKAKKSIEKGNQWLQDWVNHPATQQKIDDIFDSNFGLNTMSNLSREAYDRLKNYTPNAKAYPLKSQAKDFLDLRSKGYASEEGYPIMIHQGNRGVSYTHHRMPSAKPDHERFGNWTSLSPDMNEIERASTTIHEGTHDWLRQSTLNVLGYDTDVLQSLDPDVQRVVLQRRQLEQAGTHPDDIRRIMGENDYGITYYANPAEVHARTMEIRNAFGIKPDQKVTADDWEQIRLNGPLKANRISPFHFKMFDSNQSAADLMNRLLVAPAAVGVGAAAMANQPEMEQGGQLTKLDQLTNFTNYNTKQPGGWLDKYEG